MQTQIIHPYINKDRHIAGGKAIIIGTRTRVINIIAYHKLGYSAEELSREFPHLSLSKIYDALSFYYENKTELDKEIKSEQESSLLLHELDEH
ncbi:MAG: DUF433 domain-containing protein [candidate division KSB1 bacterium]|nr:DUF433 domain-containing protein [candidate division KSB1 bacterium]